MIDQLSVTSKAINKVSTLATYIRPGPKIGSTYICNYNGSESNSTVEKKYYSKYATDTRMFGKSAPLNEYNKQLSFVKS